MDKVPRIYLYKRLVDAKLFIDKHFAEPVTIGHFAGKACLSQFHFIRLFKTVFGRTPHQYLMKIRMAKAKELLQNGCSVTESCYAVGFESLGSYSSLFQKLNGINPSAYAGEIKKRNRAMAERPLNFIPGCFAMANNV